MLVESYVLCVAQGFKYFQPWLRGKEELLLTVVNEDLVSPLQKHRHPSKDGTESLCPCRVGAPRASQSPEPPPTPPPVAATAATCPPAAAPLAWTATAAHPCPGSLRAPGPASHTGNRVSELLHGNERIITSPSIL